MKAKSTKAPPKPARKPHLRTAAGALPGSGAPIQLSLKLVDEDPHQPRTSDNPGFSQQSLEELAETIRLRGVKTPISVRNHPSAPGRYLINHGARRTRASHLAGRTTIPAFIDNDYNEADQVIENLQRDALTPREIADFIGRELAKGVKHGAIAKSIGKSPSFVTQHVALLDLPESIARAFVDGRCRDVTVINELVTAHKRHPADVARWLANPDQEVTRSAVKLLREFLKHDAGAAPVSAFVEYTPAARPKAVGATDMPRPPTGRFQRPVVLVSHKRRAARLLLARRPSADGLAWVRYEDDQTEVELDVGQIRLDRLIEG